MTKRGQMGFMTLVAFIILFASYIVIRPVLLDFVTAAQGNLSNSSVANFLLGALDPMILLVSIGALLFFGSLWARGWR